MVECPICGKSVREASINNHIDSGCSSYIETEPPTSASSFFKGILTKKDGSQISSQPISSPTEVKVKTGKRTIEDTQANGAIEASSTEPPAKKAKQNAFQRAAPLAERMRPTTLDEVYGQDLVGPEGVLRGLIEQDRVPSMILWGGAGTGKTTIARVIANMVGSRFVEINSTSSGVAECKKIFTEAKSELGLTGRKTIIFCDEIHRFSKSQQDVFLGPVEAGHVTLIGATTENPSFKVQHALLSRCRTFTLSKLADEHIITILNRALQASRLIYNPGPLASDELIQYLAAFADGDARTSLNLLELAMDLSTRSGMTLEQLKSALTKTLVYDRSGDQHYDTISAFHKSVRGSDPDAALYYLARMIQSGEDALFIARRMVVMASEDIGLADNSLLSLATATYTAAEKIGMPEARINLAHCTVALCLAPKSTRAYRGLDNATSALQEPGVAGIPIPIHLRNAPTRLMKELGYGKEYKYNPNYIDGRVKQDYLPERLKGRKFLEDLDMGTERDPDLDFDLGDAPQNISSSGDDSRRMQQPRTDEQQQAISVSGMQARRNHPDHQPPSIAAVSVDDASPITPIQPQHDGEEHEEHNQKEADDGETQEAREEQTVSDPPFFSSNHADEETPIVVVVDGDDPPLADNDAEDEGRKSASPSPTIGHRRGGHHDEFVIEYE